MKQCFKNLKCIISGILISALMVGNVYAQEITENNTESDANVITYDEAISLATKANSNLKQIADTFEYLDKSRSILYQGTEVPELPDNGQSYLVTVARYQRLNAANSLNTQQKTLRVTEELTKVSIEAGVKGEMTTITTLEKNYELAKQSLELAKQQVTQKGTMYRLGMLSWNDYEKAMKDVDTQEEQLKQLEMSINQEYNSFKKLLGLNADEDFKIEYEVEYEPIEKVSDMDFFVNNKISTDLGLKIEKENAESSAFGLNLFVDTGNVTDYDKQKLDVENAQRNYAESVKAKENSIRNAYIGLQNMESQRAVIENQITQAKADLETAKINYEVGNITKIQYDAAELAVTKAETELVQNTLTHDMNKFMLDNTCLLSGSTSTTSTK